MQPGDLRALTSEFPILLSDDDSKIITMVKLMLEHAGLTAFAALDPRDTLHLCRSAPVSLVISDVMKPVMNGFEMLGYLRADPACSHLAFMFLTTNYREVMQQHAQLGADSCLCKPFTREDLIATVQNILLTRATCRAPFAYDPALVAAIHAQDRTYAAGQWYGPVWTTRRLT